MTSNCSSFYYFLQVEFLGTRTKQRYMVIKNKRSISGLIEQKISKVTQFYKTCTRLCNWNMYYNCVTGFFVDDVPI